MTNHNDQKNFKSQVSTFKPYKFGFAFMLLLSCILFSCQQSSDKNRGQQFGEKITLTDAVTLAEIYASPEKYEGREILVEGKITQVCQTRGCWMKLMDGERELIVRFKDYGFFVPKDASASKAIIQGIFTTKPDRHVQEESHAQQKGEQAMDHAEESKEADTTQNREKNIMKRIDEDFDSPYSFIAKAVIIYPPG